MTRIENSIAWVLEPAQDTLKPDFISRLPKSAKVAAFLSTFFSYALAKTYLVAHLPHSLSSGRVPSAAVLFLFSISTGMLGFYSCTFLMSRVARLATGMPAALSDWFSLGILAILPLHLTLPLAMLCRPLGGGGRLIFALGEISLWGLILRRLASGVQFRYQWPFWGGLLVVISPFLLSALMLLLCASLLVVIGCLALLGLLA
jgi:hypothetical protein